MGQEREKLHGMSTMSVVLSCILAFIIGASLMFMAMQTIGGVMLLGGGESESDAPSESMSGAPAPDNRVTELPPAEQMPEAESDADHREEDGGE